MTQQEQKKTERQLIQDIRHLSQQPEFLRVVARVFNESFICQSVMHPDDETCKSRAIIQHHMQKYFEELQVVAPEALTRIIHYQMFKKFN